ncbi:hypothetical protein KC878_03415 [Candidatus Saccharibacteria bacterium]|nr:hypothetical protein [Candidatus Saccharibacteria bacterium]MCB9820977.1 hypothetical protein [Candidatus Nomurabacteria bacterium]
MNISLNSLKTINYKKLSIKILNYYRLHNFTALVIVAGGFVGFALFRVNSLNNSVNDPTSLDTTVLSEAEPLILTKLNFDQTTVDRLNALALDEDVQIDSNLPDNRNNPFDDKQSSQLDVPAQ